MLNRPLYIRAICSILIFAFILQDIVWADPGILESKASSLQIESKFNPFSIQTLYENRIEITLQALLSGIAKDLENFDYSLRTPPSKEGIISTLDFRKKSREGEAWVIPCSVVGPNVNTPLMYEAIVSQASEGPGKWSFYLKPAVEKREARPPVIAMPDEAELRRDIERRIEEGKPVDIFDRSGSVHEMPIKQSKVLAPAPGTEDEERSKLRQGLSRREFLWLAGSTLLASYLTGCGNKSGSDTVPDATLAGQLPLAEQPLLLGGAVQYTGSSHITLFHRDFMPVMEPAGKIAPLLAREGHNTVVFYLPPKNLTAEDRKAVAEYIGNLYKAYGMRTVLVHFAGLYADPYGEFLLANPTPANIKRLTGLITDFASWAKDLGPAIAAIKLGNENDYYVTGAGLFHLGGDPSNTVRLSPEEYYKLMGDLAGAYKSVDPGRPVLLGHGKLGAKHTELIASANFDGIAVNIYPNWEKGRPASSVMTVDELTAFLRTQTDVADALKKPLYIGEFGESSSGSLGEDGQARFAANFTAAMAALSGKIKGAFWHEYFPEEWKDREIHPSESGLSLFTLSNGVWQPKKAFSALSRGYRAMQAKATGAGQRKTAGSPAECLKTIFRYNTLRYKRDISIKEDLLPKRKKADGAGAFSVGTIYKEVKLLKDLGIIVEGERPHTIQLRPELYNLPPPPIGVLPRLIEYLCDVESDGIKWLTRYSIPPEAVEKLKILINDIIRQETPAIPAEKPASTARNTRFLRDETVSMLEDMNAGNTYSGDNTYAEGPQNAASIIKAAGFNAETAPLEISNTANFKDIGSESDLVGRIIKELSDNVEHAEGAAMTLWSRKVEENGNVGVEIFCIDSGSGIDSVRAAFEEGYTTTGKSWRGKGLRGVKTLALSGEKGYLEVMTGRERYLYLPGMLEPVSSPTPLKRGTVVRVVRFLKPLTPAARSDGASSIAGRIGEGEVAAAFKRFAAKCRDEMQAIRKCFESGDAKAIMKHIKAVFAKANKEFSGDFRELVRDAMMALAGIELFANLGELKKDVFSRALKEIETVLGEFEKLMAAGRLLDVREAWVTSGVLDASKVLAPNAPHGDGFIWQGTESDEVFKSILPDVRKNNITEKYKDRILRLSKLVLDAGVLSPDNRKALEERMSRFNKGLVKIYGFKSIVRGKKDFFHGWYSDKGDELFLATDVIAELDARGPPTLSDEYILHEILCPLLGPYPVGHYAAILLQKKIFPQHYPDEEWAKERHPERLYKGLLGIALRDSIDRIEDNVMEKIFHDIKNKFSMPLEKIRNIDQLLAGERSKGLPEPRDLDRVMAALQGYMFVGNVLNKTARAYLDDEVTDDEALKKLRQRLPELVRIKEELKGILAEGFLSGYEDLISALRLVMTTGCEEVIELANSAVRWRGRSMEKFSISEIGELVKQVSDIYKDKGMTFNFTPTEEALLLIDVFTYKRILRTALEELILNAVKYSKTESIDVAADLNKDGELVMKVTDHGKGIPPDRQEAIFMPGVSEAKIKWFGTGFGLSGIKKDIESTGGYIKVESEEGKGATFTFTLPVNAPLTALKRPKNGPLITVISGLAGSGRRMISRWLAAKLGLGYINGGFITRALLYRMLEENVDTGDETSVKAFSREFLIEKKRLYYSRETITLDGVDTTVLDKDGLSLRDKIRRTVDDDPANEELLHKITRFSGVQEVLKEFFRTEAKRSRDSGDYNGLIIRTTEPLKDFTCEGFNVVNVGLEASSRVRAGRIKKSHDALVALDRSTGKVDFGARDDLVKKIDTSYNKTVREVCREALDHIRLQASPVDNMLRSGPRSQEEFELSLDDVRRNDVTAEYKDQIINALERQESSPEIERLIAKFRDGEYRIYGFEFIARSEDDFLMGWNDREGGELFIATDIIGKLRLSNGSKFDDEYLLRLLLHPIPGYETLVGEKLKTLIEQRVLAQRMTTRIASEGIGLPEPLWMVEDLLNDAAHMLLNVTEDELLSNAKPEPDNLIKTLLERKEPFSSTKPEKLYIHVMKALMELKEDPRSSWELKKHSASFERYHIEFIKKILEDVKYEHAKLDFIIPYLTAYIETGDSEYLTTRLSARRRYIEKTYQDVLSVFLYRSITDLFINLIVDIGLPSRRLKNKYPQDDILRSLVTTAEELRKKVRDLADTQNKFKTVENLESFLSGLKLSMVHVNGLVNRFEQSFQRNDQKVVDAEDDGNFRIIRESLELLNKACGDMLVAAKPNIGLEHLTEKIELAIVKRGLPYVPTSDKIKLVAMEPYSNELKKVRQGEPVRVRAQVYIPGLTPAEVTKAGERDFAERLLRVQILTSALSPANTPVWQPIEMRFIKTGGIENHDYIFEGTIPTDRYASVPAPTPGDPGKMSEFKIIVRAAVRPEDPQAKENWVYCEALSRTSENEYGDARLVVTPQRSITVRDGNHANTAAPQPSIAPAAPKVPPLGCPARLLGEIYAKVAYKLPDEPYPKIIHKKELFTAADLLKIAEARGGANSRTTVGNERRVLQDLGLLSGDRTGYYLTGWLEKLSGNQWSELLAEKGLNKASPSDDDLVLTRAVIARLKTEVGAAAAPLTPEDAVDSKVKLLGGSPAYNTESIYKVANEDILALISGLKGLNRKGGGFLGIGSYHNLDIALAMECDAIILLDASYNICKLNLEVLRLVERTEDFHKIKDAMRRLSNTHGKPLFDDYVSLRGYDDEGYSGRTPLYWANTVAGNEKYFRKLKRLIKEGKVAVALADIAEPESMKPIRQFFDGHGVGLNIVNLTNVEAYVNINNREDKLAASLRMAGASKYSLVIASAPYNMKEEIRIKYGDSIHVLQPTIMQMDGGSAAGWIHVLRTRRDIDEGVFIYKVSGRKARKAKAPPIGRPAQLLDEMRAMPDIFSENGAKSSEELSGNAVRKGRSDSQRTIQRELAVLVGLGLVRKTATRYYLASWLDSITDRQWAKLLADLGLNNASPTAGELSETSKLIARLKSAVGQTAGISPDTAPASYTDWDRVKKIAPDIFEPGSSDLRQENLSLTDEEQMQLFREFKRGNVAAKWALVQANTPLVKHMVMRRIKQQPVLERYKEDLISACIFGDGGLMRAVELFDPEAGFMFSTYAGTAIKNRLEKEIGRITRKTIRGQDPIKDADESIPDETLKDPAISAMEKIDSGKLLGLLAEFKPKRNAIIFKRRVMDGEKRESLAKEFKLTRQRIDQIVKETAERLRQEMDGEEVAEEPATSAIRAALADVESKFERGESAAARGLLRELIADLEDVHQSEKEKLTEKIKELKEKWDARYPSSSSEGLAIGDMPGLIIAAEELSLKDGWWFYLEFVQTYLEGATESLDRYDDRYKHSKDLKELSKSYKEMLRAEDVLKDAMDIIDQRLLTHKEAAKEGELKNAIDQRDYIANRSNRARTYRGRILNKSANVLDKKGEELYTKGKFGDARAAWDRAGEYYRDAVRSFNAFLNEAVQQPDSEYFAATVEVDLGIAYLTYGDHLNRLGKRSGSSEEAMRFYGRAALCYEKSEAYLSDAAPIVLEGRASYSEPMTEKRDRAATRGKIVRDKVTGDTIKEAGAWLANDLLQKQPVAPTANIFSKENFLAARKKLEGYVERTPLVPLPIFSASGQTVLIKDESRQRGRSFKTRGVSYEVFRAVERVLMNDPALLRKGLKIVTQTDGNHGAAMIRATISAIDKYSKEHPQLKPEIFRIEPVVFAMRNVSAMKLDVMKSALEEYRKFVGDDSKGMIQLIDGDYHEARRAVDRYIKEEGPRALYMAHGGTEIMQGHSTAAMEVVEQLNEMGITEDKKVCFIIPVGAGGPIGLAAAAKVFRKNTAVVMVQTPRYGAFVESYRSGSLSSNKSAEEADPYTIKVDGRPFIYEDGIAVDGPESAYVLKKARLYLDDAVLANPQRALDEVAPRLLSDLDGYYGAGKGVVGGTTAIAADALLNVPNEKIKSADVVVLFGTEGNVEPVIMDHTRAMAKAPVAQPQPEGVSPRGTSPESSDGEVRRAFTTRHECRVSNVKGGPNIRISYEIDTRNYPEKGKIFVEGYINDESGIDEIGRFVLVVTRDRIDIDSYFPVGNPSDMNWGQNKNKNNGISQTFLFWLSNLAKANNIPEIYVTSLWLNNYHVFKKYFADEIRINDYSPNDNEGWQRLEEVTDDFYSEEKLKQIEIKDVETLLTTAYVRLKRLAGSKDTYRVIGSENNRERLSLLAKEEYDGKIYIPERYADELKEGVVVTVDEKSFVRIGNDIIGLAARPIGIGKIELRGAPRMPSDVSNPTKFETEEVDLPGSSGLKFKTLTNKTPAESGRAAPSAPAPGTPPARPPVNGFYMINMGDIRFNDRYKIFDSGLVLGNAHPAGKTKEYVDKISVNWRDDAEPYYDSIKAFFVSEVQKAKELHAMPVLIGRAHIFSLPFYEALKEVYGVECDVISLDDHTDCYSYKFTNGGFWSYGVREGKVSPEKLTILGVTKWSVFADDPFDFAIEGEDSYSRQLRKEGVSFELHPKRAYKNIFLSFDTDVKHGISWSAIAEILKNGTVFGIHIAEIGYDDERYPDDFEPANVRSVLSTTVEKVRPMQSESQKILRDLTQVDETARNIVEMIFSYMLTKKVVLAFDDKMGGLQAQSMIALLEGLKELKDNPKYREFLKNLVIVKSQPEKMAARLDNYMKDGYEVFVFARSTEKETLKAIEAKAHFTYIGEDGFPADAYYPLPAIVAITLARYLVPESIDEVVQNIEKLKELNIKSIIEDGSVLIFTLLPHAQQHSTQDLIKRYAILKEVLSKA